MDEHKAEILLIALLVLTVSGAAFRLKVEVAPDAKVSPSMFEYGKKVGREQSFSASLYNTGSVGCRYRLKAVYRVNNLSKVFFSKSKPLLPGMESDFSFETVPGTDNRSWNGTVYADFCGNEKEIGNFSYKQVKQIENNGRDIEAEVEEVNYTAITLETGVKKGYLIPKDVPTQWKVSSSEIIDGVSEVSFEPTVLNRKRQLEFFVFNRTSEKIIGSFKVGLEKEKTWKTLLEDNLKTVLLTASVLTNLVLLAVIGKKYTNQVKF